MQFSTQQIHAGVEPDPVTGAILTPIYQSTTYVQESIDNYLGKGYSYSRSGNPTVRALEIKLNILEGGAEARAFSTGMAATTATMLALLNAGDHAVVSDVAYGGTYRLATSILPRFAVEFTFADSSDPDAVRAALRDNTRLIFTETPANPTLKLTDIAAISEIAREHSIPHAVDNTFLTPYYQRPLGGAVISATLELDEAIKYVQNTTGSIMSPHVAWLTMQGCKTLSIRMDAQCANAMAIAEFLADHPKVESVCYPGLASFPQYALAKSQATGFGAMVCFEVKGGTSAGKILMDSLQLWSLAENLGSVESLVTHPVTMTHADIDVKERARVGITDGLVRLSVGLEAAEDLIEDLEQGLAKV
jgi:cystathionine beta-lyase/cystathionine gamma-synthase